MTSSSATETLTLTRAVAEALFDHAREGAAAAPPREVCGVLVGSRSALRVTDTERVRNVAADPRTRYELDPAETVAAVDDAEARGRDAVGFYHSHPESPARLSDVDRAQATWENHVYAIVSPAEDGGTIRAWRYEGDAAFASLAVHVVDGEA